MENEQNKLMLLAEDVSISEEAKLDPTFLTVEVKLCDSSINLNREAVSTEFINNFVETSQDHLCLPFYADVKNLLAGNYEKLGHLYDKATRKFGTNMIGSMSEFRTEEDNGVTSLYGKIKIPKRDREIVYRLVDLYEMGRFAVSTEVSYDPRECEITADGKYIAASENSSLNGLCLVWKPACQDAYALDMVAEAADDSEEIVAESEEQLSERGEKEPMKKTENQIAEAEIQNETIAEEEKQAEAVAENTVVEEAKAETAVAEEAKAETAVAEEAKPEEDPETEEDKPDDEKDAVAEITQTGEEITQPAEQANSEVLEHSVTTHESVEQCPYTGEPVHIIEYHERFIETMEEAGTLIAELDKQIAELTEIKGKYDAIMEAENAKALAEKQEKARAFAEKQGLDVQETAVAEAINALDYTRIAELTMALAEKQEPEQKDDKTTIALASFVNLEISEDKYGGLLRSVRK